MFLTQSGANRFSYLRYLFIIPLLLLYAKDVFFINLSPLLYGIDGYYYLIQVESFLARKLFYFPSGAPLVLYFFVFLKSLTQDSISAIKLGVLFLEALILAGIFAVVFEVLRNYGYAVIACLLFIVSGLHLYFIIEYISQLGAVALLLWSIFFIIKYAKSRRWAWLLPAAVLFTAAAFSHRSLIPISLAIILSFVFFSALDSAKIQAERKYSAAVWLIVALAVISPAILKLQTLFPLPLVWQNEITAAPRFPSHFATLPEIIILLLAVPLILRFFLYKSRTETPAAVRYFFGTLAVWSLLITLNPFISSANGFVSLGGRLRTLACLQVALLLPALIYAARDYHKKYVWGLAALALPFLLWSFLSPPPYGAQREYLSRREALIGAVREKMPALEEKSLVVADHGDQFVVTALSGIPAAQYFPGEKTNYHAVYWLINGIPATFVDEKMTVLFEDKSGRKTVLVKHDEHWLKRLYNSDLRRNSLAGNPHLYFYLVNSNSEAKRQNR